jgi:endonuclease/exonuclease/phosphatase family metal-dependent hydrolase
MSLRDPWSGCLAALYLAAGCAGAAHVTDPGPVTERLGDPRVLRVMTFNIRYGTAPDGRDAWASRGELAIRVIRSFDPIILGLQEALRFQLDEIEAASPHFGEVGVGRDDGGTAGEYAAILYDRRRLTPLDQGTFWLSDTPDAPGSMTWGNRFPRIATWARFSERSEGATFYVFNTHWDHESQPSRERGAQLIRERLATRTAPEDPVLVMGDFNSGEDNAAFDALTASRRGAPDADRLADSFRLVRPMEKGVGTYHAFKGDRSGAKVDAVLVSSQWQVLDADIIHLNDNDRYPSDHFPVTATLTLHRQ